MRTRKATMLAAATSAALLLAAVPALAQPSEQFPQAGEGAPLDGYTRNDGTIVLTDEGFCRFVLATALGDQRLTFIGLLDRSKKQKKAKAAAFVPAEDEAAVARCVDAVGAYRVAAPEDDAVVGWARRSPVVPESLAALLPEDFVARPLAVAGPVEQAARTSGFGSGASAPFLLDGEAWLVELDAAACGEWAGRLRDTRDDDRAIELTEARQHLYNVVPGHYYWDVTASDCDWSVDLVEIELGPDPNATPPPKVEVPRLHGDIWVRGAVPNNEYLNASQAYQALTGAGFVVGECFEEVTQFVTPDRVWKQDPLPGTLLEQGSAVDVWIGSNCDVVRGDRVEQ